MLAAPRPSAYSARHRADDSKSRHRGLRAVLALLITATGLIATAFVAGTAASAAEPGVAITMNAGTTLLPGQELDSATGQYVLSMRASGSLVVYGQGQVLWTSNTPTSMSRAVMQNDGNLVIYSPANLPIWNSQTAGHPGVPAQVLDNGLFQVLDETGPLWSSDTLNTSLAVGKRLLANYVLWSESGAYRLVMQGDGNLVLYGGTVPWGSGTAGKPGASLVMQGSGNAVLYDKSGHALWATPTFGTGAAQLANRGDGNITMITASQVVVYQAPGGSKGTTIVAAAQTQAGKPYCYAGGDQVGATKGRDAACTKVVGFDCSGLALYAVYKARGILLPHYSGTQFSQATKYGGIKVARAALLPGDLVFFIGAGGTAAAPGHVGIYVGNNVMIDAQGSGVPVGLHTLYSGYVGAVRYW
jgi:cell wall-associated NlpC family hydrolase